ncbi:MAG: hypothetical protein ACRDDJ_12275, partial [[Mycobacterium] stephanolepidis]
DRQVFFRADCVKANSYYFDVHGDVPLRPGPTVESAWRAEHYDLNDYRFTTCLARLRPPDSLYSADTECQEGTH